MTLTPEQLDLLITRRLDGRITPAESEQLRAAAAHDPGVAAMLEQSERADALAQSALRHAVRTPRPALARPVNSGFSALAAATVALAAVVAVVVIAHWRAPLSPEPAPGVAQAPGAAPTPVRPALAVPVEFVQASAPRSARQHWVNHDVVGVMNEANDRMYLFQLRQDRVRVQPVVQEY